MTDEQEPRTLGGRYELGRLVGRGGMADVHLARDLRLGRQVAVKVLRTDLARDASFLSRFRREALAAAGLSHPSIVAVYDSGEEIVHEAGGAELHVPYIVMEYIDGRTLREVLNAEGALDPSEAARITAAVLSALTYAHERGLVHRDIKPANVMVTEAGSVKVMDFGIARALADTAATMTQTQAVMGTARYLSPEQAQGLEVDGRSDVYSVGCLLYELLAGRTPFQGDPVSLVYQHLGESPTAPSTHRDGLTEALDAVTLHALEKKPEERYQNAEDFRDDLVAARTGQPVSAAAQDTYGRLVGAAGASAAGAAGAARESHGDRPVAEDRDSLTGVVFGGADVEEFERTDEMPVRERRHRGAGLLLGVIAALAIAGLSYVLWSVMGPGAEEEPTTVAVPDTVGQVETAARATLTELGFVVPDATYEESSEPQGTVIDQTPRTGSLVEGSEVRLTVSDGPSARTIPNLQGQEENSARGMLERAGFTNVREEAEEVDDPDWEGGQVIGTEPGAGESVAPDREIVLVVSSGQVTVPDVVGLDQNEAVVAISDQSLGYAIELERTAEVEAGTVMSQSEEAGDVVDQGTTVTLVVALEPRLVETATEIITVTPSPTPTPTPTDDPTEDPTDDPTEDPTDDPTEAPDPTDDPSDTPTADLPPTLRPGDPPRPTLPRPTTEPTR